MFGSNLVMPRGGITSYEQAVIKHDSIVPIRGRRTDTRPLGRRGNDNLTIRRLNNDAIAIQLYNTDIVVYNTDGTIELEPYSSKLTDDVMSSVFRRTITTQYTNPVGPVLWTKGKGYLVRDTAVLDKDLNLISGSSPFTHYSVDRKAANAACRKGFNQFKLWVMTQVRLGIDPRGDTRYYGHYNLSDSAIACLDEPDRYGAITAGMSKYRSVEDHLQMIRHQVIQYHDAIVETEVPHVTSWSQLSSIQASKRRLG